MAAEFWQVGIALEGTDWDLLRRALFLVMPSERWIIGLGPGEETETATLYIDVMATSHGQAEELAEEIYRKALKEAGLPDSSPLVLGARTPIFGPEPYSRLVEESRRLIEAGRYEMAVIRVQTACELFARSALERLTVDIRAPDESIRNLFPSSLSLVDRRSRALVDALTGSDIAAQPWWQAYRTHVARRNGIVHGGLSVSEKEAEESRAAAQAFIGHLGWLWEGQPKHRFRMPERRGHDERAS